MAIGFWGAKEGGQMDVLEFARAVVEDFEVGLGKTLEFHGVGVADREISVGLDFSRSIHSAEVVQDTKEKIGAWR
jgi:hypothetical protein